MSSVTKTNSTGYVSKMGILHPVLLILALFYSFDAIAVKPWPDFNNPQINKLFNPLPPQEVNVKVIRPVITGWNESSFVNSWGRHVKKYGGLSRRSDWKLTWRINYIDIDEDRCKANFTLESTVTLLLPTFKFPAGMPMHKRRRYDDYLRDVIKGTIHTLKNIYYFHNRSGQMFKSIIVPVTLDMEGEKAAKIQERKIWNAMNQAYKESEALTKRVNKRDAEWLADVYPDFR
ncbi:hypothetical protein CMI37_35000 [Candidatus Pacearchaeota archaeon]|nr:hypothetical protein [Candidatus Pacearchaeota archaeon]|tara:strand:+ start:95 stop:790 length:696 start_codon:yes stop_codon:yes gene_type:complete